MQETKQQVSISDYLQGRRSNLKPYERLAKAIENNCKLLFKQYPEVGISITLSAKYQTPRITISENDAIPEKVGSFEQEIMAALEEVGFEFSESEDKDTYYLISFED
jgi:hypothetical protein